MDRIQLPTPEDGMMIAIPDNDDDAVIYCRERGINYPACLEQHTHVGRLYRGIRYIMLNPEFYKLTLKVKAQNQILSKFQDRIWYILSLDEQQLADMTHADFAMPQDSRVVRHRGRICMA